MRNVGLYYSQLIQPLNFFATVNFCTNIQYKMATGKRASQNNLKLFEKVISPTKFGSKMIPKLWSCCYSLMHGMLCQWQWASKVFYKQILMCWSGSAAHYQFFFLYYNRCYNMHQSCCCAAITCSGLPFDADFWPPVLISGLNSVDMWRCSWCEFLLAI